jgi:hypothetical protein
VVNNSLYLRRRSKIIPPSGAGEALPPNYVASLVKNIEPLGYTFSEPLADACQSLTLEQLTQFYQTLIADLRRARGVQFPFGPMYPNFPAQVMALAQSRLYLNAFVHYLSGGRLFPRTKTEERLPLQDSVKLQVIELGTEADFESLFGQIALANTSISGLDKEDLTWFVSSYGDGIQPFLPARVPQKENMAFLASLLMQHTTQAEPFIAGFCRTATDILRLAVALSGGDVSLAAAAKFRTFSRPERRLLLGLLERAPNAAEDMRRWKGRWVRLGEKLHPGEYRRQYPISWQAFNVLRSDLPLLTFNSRIEKALEEHDSAGAIAILTPRPGDFARRLDHLLRTAPEHQEQKYQEQKYQEQTVEAFAGVAGKVSTPVLLQVMTHFQTRRDGSDLRVFFSKGSLPKAYGKLNTLPELSAGICERAVAACRDALRERFRVLPPLGRCFVDPALMNYPVPFSQRSASKSFRTIPRGSRLPLPEDCRVLRLFLWWKNGKDRTDVDLSAAMFDADFRYVDVVSYYELRCDGGVHSGDIVDAPNGASEFVDITLDRMQARGIRYVVMTLGGYTPQPFCDLPECFAGWMSRSAPQSGEIYDPRTVQDRLDLTAESRIAIPLLVDVADRTLVWCDLALKKNPEWVNSVQNNLRGIALSLHALTSLKKPTLYDLFELHAQARGTLVGTPEEAETVFSVASGTPFRLDEIASQFLQ